MHSGRKVERINTELEVTSAELSLLTHVPKLSRPSASGTWDSGSSGSHMFTLAGGTKCLNDQWDSGSSCKMILVPDTAPPTPSGRQEALPSETRCKQEELFQICASSAMEESYRSGC